MSKDSGANLPPNKSNVSIHYLNVRPRYRDASASMELYISITVGGVDYY